MRLIDADKLITEYDKIHIGEPGRARRLIEEQPTADVQEVKHGKWLWVDGVRCSNCNHKLQTTGLPSYCPNCGAKMRGEEDGYKWIPVTERLPEKHSSAIVTDFYHVTLAYTNNFDEWMDYDGNKLKNVTAWMPLPEPYKEGGADA